MKTGVSFFCPAYNDQDNIRSTVENVIGTLESLEQDYEIIIVEDGSPDGTAEVADALAEEYPGVKVIHHKTNRGYGGALRSGFCHAVSFDKVAYTDGDGQYDFAEFTLLLQAYDSGCAVAGYRLNRADSRKRVIQTGMFGLLLKLLFRLNVRDVNCSMKLFSRETLSDIVITSDSAFIDAEILIKLQRNGVEIRQVGVHHRPRLHGIASGAKLSVVLSTIRDAFSLAFSKGKAGNR